MKFKSKNKIIALLLAFNYSAFASESFDGPWLRDIEKLNKPGIVKTALSIVPQSFVNMQKINKEIKNAEHNPLKNYVKSSHLTSLVNEYAKKMGITDTIDKVKISLDENTIVKVVSKFEDNSLNSISMKLGENFLQNGNLSDAELKSIIMHELAHIKNQDSLNERLWKEKMEDVIGGTYFASLPIFYKLTKKFQPTRFKILNTMIKFAACSTAHGTTAVTSSALAESRLSKKCEYQADADSLRCHKDLDSSIDSLKKVHKYNDNLFAQQNPDISLTESCAIKWLDYFFGTHPTLDERVSNLHKTMEEINYTASKS
jgi:hypothetical protein